MSDAFLYLGGLALAGYFLRLWLEDYRHNAYRINEHLAAGKPVTAEMIQVGLPGSTPVSWVATTIAIVGSVVTASEYK